MEDQSYDKRLFWLVVLVNLLALALILYMDYRGTL
jgi:hypothetical protein